MLSLGIERVILATVAVENPKLVEEACKRFNDYIIVSIDARDGFGNTRLVKRNQPDHGTICRQYGEITPYGLFTPTLSVMAHSPNRNLQPLWNLLIAPKRR